jgi:choline dehydrogenase-like flavoprotein
MGAKFSNSTQVDFLVIGAGGAGGVVAKELSSNGFQVVVLEQGPYLHEDDFVHDEMNARNMYVNPVFGEETLTNKHDKQPNTFRRSENQVAKQQPAVLYGRCVGGGTVHFTANYWRLHEVDFRERSHWGAIAGTGFSDWPISYADLEPYYTKAEYDLGISGLAGASPFDPPRSKPYPLPPMPAKSSGVLLERAAKKLGLHAFPAPLAVLSQPYRGRSGCQNCGFCEWFGCEWAAKSSSLASVIPMAEETGRCEIRPNSYVKRIETDARGRVTGAMYFDETNNIQFQRAKAVVVCANGAETPRLLLLSDSNHFPHGLANSSGLVGKFLMFDHGAVARGVFEHPLNDYQGVQVTRIIHDFYDADPRRGFYGGAGIDARFDELPISYGLSGFPPGAPRWGADFKRALRHYFCRSMMVFAHTTSLALESNSISLDPTLKDAWGQPAIRVTYMSHPDDIKTMQFFSTKIMEVLEAAGALEKWGFPPEPPRSGVHLLGTCRMGNDPGASVVNKFHQAHDVPNLFIVDGSSMVTAGRHQPTCTIQALAYRAADHMSQMARSGSIPASIS